MLFLATQSDVTIVRKKSVTGIRAIHLSSEDHTEVPDSMAFTTTSALDQMFQAWWDEFRVKDGDSGAMNIPFRTLFRGSLLRENLRPYEAADNKIPIEPPSNPNMGYTWLPQPVRRIDVGERDWIYLERNVRVALRALNFAEVVLQASKADEISEDMQLRMRRSMSKAIKTMMQSLVSTLCGFMQMRRDQYLMGARGLSIENIQTLRHAPWADQPKIFPAQLLHKLNEVNYQSLQTRALLRATRPTERGNYFRGRGRGRGGPPPFHAHERNYGHASRGSSNFSHGYVQSCSPRSPVARAPVLPIVFPPSEVKLKCEATEKELCEASDEERCEIVQLNISSNYEWEESQLLLQSRIPVGGRLRFFWKEWRAIGASRRIARWLSKGYRLPFAQDQESLAREGLRKVCPAELRTRYAEGSEKAKALKSMLNELLEKDVIEPVKAESPVFFNIVFLRPKPGGKWRLILDVSRLNKFLVVEKFTMDTVQVMRKAIECNSWGSSIDLSDAYHHIPIHENFRCFLAFHAGGVAYLYKACPFGLSPIPQVFTELSTVVKVFVRKEWSCMAYQYLDDWLFVSQSREKVEWVTRAFVRLCIKLGLIVNLKKSQLQPTRQLVHLGTLWDFKKAQVRVPDDKVEAITTLASKVYQSRRSSLPLLETLMGKLVSVEKLVPWGRFNLRGFQSQLITELRSGRSFRWVALTATARRDLQWWSRRDNIKVWTAVRPRQATVTIHTDASKTGWGAASPWGTLRGRWSLRQSSLHINVLEMLAVYLALLRWADRLQGEVVLFRIDNLSVVYYINKQGGTRSAVLMQATERVLRLAIELRVTLQASHIKGELNVLADLLSRSEVVLKTEWRLADDSFRWLKENSPWGEPSLELFANRLNRHLNRFVSPCDDSSAVATDALVVAWPDEVCYAFPPTTIVDRVALKMLQERPRRLLLVAPWLPRATWFPILREHAQSITLFPNSRLGLIQPHFKHAMENPQQLCLALWCISFQD